MGGSGIPMRDGKPNARNEPVLEMALRALETHRAWECPIHHPPRIGIFLFF
jgi:hypothetical protein